MTLAGCMIVKNGDDFIEYSIRSIWDYIDEFIAVVDRDSTDNTLRILHSFDPKKMTIVEGCYNGDKQTQRNVYLSLVQSDWILQIDDDEVYTQEGMQRILESIHEVGGEGSKFFWINYPFLHFWKDFDHYITGDVWEQTLQRLIRNHPDLWFDTSHHRIDYRPVSGAIPKEHVHTLRKGVKVYHYSYVKPSCKIHDKIRYYMLRDKPGVTEENADEWADKHPFFSDNFDQPRYGPDGIYCCGRHGNYRDVVHPYTEDHPEIIEPELPMLKYKVGMNQYMEDHWQYHNHLDHDRHQNRLKYTAKFCNGRTLEVGCANGLSTKTMQEARPSCVFEGVEPTEWGIRSARATYPEIRFHKAMGEDLPFSDGYFDTVLVAELIEHCFNPVTLIDECFRVARRKLIITTPSQPHDDPDHKRHFTVQEMKKFLQRYVSPSNIEIRGLDEDGRIVKKEQDIYFTIAIGKMP